MREEQKTMSKKTEPTAAEIAQRAAERLERWHVAVNVLKKLEPEAWRNDWYLLPLDQLEIKANEARERADLRRHANAGSVAA